MKRVLDHIAVCSERFAQVPMFGYLRDKSIDPQQRLCFMPMMAHFVFSFMDINRYILRNEALDTPLQRILNTHTYEDATHWPWWIRDMKNAGFDKTCNFTEAMLFVWSEATRRSRLLTYDIISIVARAKPVQLLAIVETIEATGYRFGSTTAEVCREIANNHFSYLGEKHLSVESGHAMGTEEIMSYLEEIQLSDEELADTIALVNKLFKAFTDFVGEMYDWATTHDLNELRSQRFFRERANNRANRPMNTQELTQELTQNGGPQPGVPQPGAPQPGNTLLPVRPNPTQHDNSRC
jgi:hypothetical protein